MAKTPVESKRTVREVVGNISCYDLDGGIRYAIGTLQELLKFHGDGARLDYGEHTPYDDSKSYNVVVDRLETDEEFETRTKTQAMAKVARIRALEDELARLKGTK